MVDLIINSEFDTRGVDAFALSLIKSERQMRRLFTHLVFQSEAFKKTDCPELKKILSDNTNVYFEHLENCFNQISIHSTQNLIGEDYPKLKSVLDKSKKYRNKIFHGQLTSLNLSRDVLLELAQSIRQWCELLSVNALDKIGYDGFIRDSFQKSKVKKQSDILKKEFLSVKDYENFINLITTENKK